MASTSSSGALLASSQSPLVMCTLPQMLFKESSVSWRWMHVVCFPQGTSMPTTEHQ